MEKKKRRMWTLDEEIKLLDLCSKVPSFKEIAKELDRTEGAIIARLKKIWRRRGKKW